jgi:hypothetical protein
MLDARQEAFAHHYVLTGGNTKESCKKAGYHPISGSYNDGIKNPRVKAYIKLLQQAQVEDLFTEKRKLLKQLDKVVKLAEFASNYGAMVSAINSKIKLLGLDVKRVEAEGKSPVQVEHSHKYAIDRKELERRAKLMKEDVKRLELKEKKEKKEAKKAEKGNKDDM